LQPKSTQITYMYNKDMFFQGGGKGF